MTSPPPLPSAVSEPPLIDPGTRDQLMMFGVMLAVAIGNTGLQSVMPALGRTIGLPDPVIALSFSFSALVWAMAASFWARRTNRHGYRRMVITGMSGFIASLLICGTAILSAIHGWLGAWMAFTLFIVGRLIYGFFGAASPPAAQALVATRSDRAERTKALALLASAFGLGTIVGPALAPFFLLPWFSLAGPSFIFALFGMAMVAVIWAKLEDRPATETQSQPYPFDEPVIGGEPSDTPVPADGTAEHQSDVRITDPRILPWLTVGIVGGHAQAIVGQTMGFMIIDRMALEPMAAQPFIGLVLMSGAGATLLAQWGIIPRLNLAPKQLVRWGAILALIGSLGIAVSSGLHAIAVAFAIASMGFGFIRPGFTAGASLAVSDTEQAAIGGRVTSTNGLCFVLGPTMGVSMYQLWQPLPYLVGAVALGLLSIFIWLRIGRNSAQ